MMRLTNQRGVSLMLLIIMITVFAGVAIGIVTLLRTRHESYPYQVQPYQALALADAGVQFATRYALDNGIDFSTNPATYIGPTYSAKNTYSLGNGQFQLRYEPAATCTPGQMGSLYCKGVVGTATREVKVTDFGGMIGKISGNALLMNPTSTPQQQRLVSDWGAPNPFTGWRVAAWQCGVSQYGQGNIWIPCDGPNYNPIKIAVSYPTGYDYVANPLKLYRLLAGQYDLIQGHDRFAWDEVCARGSLGGSMEITVPNWDKAAHPIPVAGEYIQPRWNVLDPNRWPYGERKTSDRYCQGWYSPYPGVGQFGNSDSWPVAMDFALVEPPPGTTFYLEFPTIVMDPVTYVWTTYTNRYVFTATKAY